MKTYWMSAIITLCFLLFSVTLSGCVTANKPNIPFTEPISGLNYIEKKNPLLATEFRKLPEIQDGLNKEEKAAIERLSQLYRIQQLEFDDAFNKMYEIGLPEQRKYCSTLQALFWIAMERSFSKENNPVNPYSLDSLLNEAWTFRPRISLKMINKIVASIKDPEIRTNYEKWIIEKKKYISFNLANHAKFSPDIFEEWVHKKIKELKNKLWNNYNVVLDRLNSPELIDFYVTKHIGYSNYWDILGYDRYGSGDSYYVFKNRSGDCLYISEFIVQALRKNGYRAYVEKKSALRCVDAWHAVCVFESHGKKYIIDDGKPNKSGIMKYDDYLE